MPKKLFALLLAALMVCGAALALADGIAVTDMHGREITLDAPATRIVALTAEETRSSAAANTAIIRNP